MNVAGVSGPKACQVKAWAGASLTSGGPGNPFHEILQGLKGRNTIRAGHVPPLQGKEICWGTFSWGFTPGCNRTGFQPSEQCRIVSELDALHAEVDALKRLQAGNRSRGRRNVAEKNLY